MYVLDVVMYAYILTVMSCAEKRLNVWQIFGV